MCQCVSFFRFFFSSFSTLAMHAFNSRKANINNWVQMVDERRLSTPSLSSPRCLSWDGWGAFIGSSHFFFCLVSFCRIFFFFRSSLAEENWNLNKLFHSIRLHRNAATTWKGEGVKRTEWALHTTQCAHFYFLFVTVKRLIWLWCVALACLVFEQRCWLCVMQKEKESGKDTVWTWGCVFWRKQTKGDRRKTQIEHKIVCECEKSKRQSERMGEAESKWREWRNYLWVDNTSGIF